MSILEYTTRDMPPFWYVRGNQESVLTKIDEIFTVDLTLCSKCQIDGENILENMNFDQKDASTLS